MCFLCCRMKLLNLAISTRVIGCFYEGLKEEAKECKVRDKVFWPEGQVTKKRAREKRSGRQK